MTHSRLFGPFPGNHLQRERDRHGAPTYTRDPKCSFCETCQRAMPRGAEVVRKGWKCRECRG